MTEYKITGVKARQVYNAIWDPTLATTVTINGRYSATCIAPKGQSTGEGEAIELRDGGIPFGGMGCSKAIESVNHEIADAIIGMDATDQRTIDRTMIELDGTDCKGRLGANAIVSTSAAVAKAAAMAVGLPLYKYLYSNARVLPVPVMSIIDGAHYAFDCGPDFQEFNLYPLGASSLYEAIRHCYDVFSVLGDMFEKEYGGLAARLCNGAGSYCIPVRSHRKICEYLTKAIEKSGHMGEMFFGVDCAASHFYDKDTGLYTFESSKRTREELLDIYKGLIKDFPIVSIEDPFEENDLDGHILATKELGIQVVGDDLFVTNSDRLRKYIPQGACNAMVWKYNQVGTISEALDAADVARCSSYAIQTSERSGENEDSVLADLTVAIGGSQIKTGVVARCEHTVKYNRLLKIEEDLGADAIYPGKYLSCPFMNIK